MKAETPCRIDLGIHFGYLEADVLAAGERVIELNPLAGVIEYLIQDPASKSAPNPREQYPALVNGFQGQQQAPPLTPD